MAVTKRQADSTALIGRMIDHSSGLRMGATTYVATDADSAATAEAVGTRSGPRTWACKPAVGLTVSVEDIDRWDAGDVREVFNATRSRAEAAFKAADGIAELPAFRTWGGEASEAAEESIGQTRKDLDAHGNEALAVAQAARTVTAH